MTRREVRLKGEGRTASLEGPLQCSLVLLSVVHSSGTLCLCSTLGGNSDSNSEFGVSPSS